MEIYWAVSIICFISTFGVFSYKDGSAYALNKVQDNTFKHSLTIVNPVKINQENKNTKTKKHADSHKTLHHIIRSKPIITSVLQMSRNNGVFDDYLPYEFLRQSYSQFEVYSGKYITTLHYQKHFFSNKMFQLVLIKSQKKKIDIIKYFKKLSSLKKDENYKIKLAKKFLIKQFDLSKDFNKIEKYNNDIKDLLSGIQKASSDENLWMVRELFLQRPFFMIWNLFAAAQSKINFFQHYYSIYFMNFCLNTAYKMDERDMNKRDSPGVMNILLKILLRTAILFKTTIRHTMHTTKAMMLSFTCIVALPRVLQKIFHTLSSVYKKSKYKFYKKHYSRLLTSERSKLYYKPLSFFYEEEAIVLLLKLWQFKNVDETKVFINNTDNMTDQLTIGAFEFSERFSSYMYRLLSYDKEKCKKNREIIIQIFANKNSNIYHTKKKLNIVFSEKEVIEIEKCYQQLDESFDVVNALRKIILHHTNHFKKFVADLLLIIFRSFSLYINEASKSSENFDFNAFESVFSKSDPTFFDLVLSKPFYEEFARDITEAITDLAIALTSYKLGIWIPQYFQKEPHIFTRRFWKELFIGTRFSNVSFSRIFNNLSKKEMLHNKQFYKYYMNFFIKIEKLQSSIFMKFLSIYNKYKVLQKIQTSDDFCQNEDVSVCSESITRDTERNLFVACYTAVDSVIGVSNIGKKNIKIRENSLCISETMETFAALENIIYDANAEAAKSNYATNLSAAMQRDLSNLIIFKNMLPGHNKNRKLDNELYKKPMKQPNVIESNNADNLESSLPSNVHHEADAEPEPEPQSASDQREKSEYNIIHSAVSNFMNDIIPALQRKNLYASVEILDNEDVPLPMKSQTNSKVFCLTTLEGRKEYFYSFDNNLLLKFTSHSKFDEKKTFFHKRIITKAVDDAEYAFLLGVSGILRTVTSNSEYKFSGILVTHFVNIKESDKDTEKVIEGLLWASRAFSRFEAAKIAGILREAKKKDYREKSWKYLFDNLTPFEFNSAAEIYVKKNYKHFDNSVNEKSLISFPEVKFSFWTVMKNAALRTILRNPYNNLENFSLILGASIAVTVYYEVNGFTQNEKEFLLRLFRISAYNMFFSNEYKEKFTDKEKICYALYNVLAKNNSSYENVKGHLEKIYSILLGLKTNAVSWVDFLQLKPAFLFNDSFSTILFDKRKLKEATKFKWRLFKHYSGKALNKIGLLRHKRTNLGHNEFLDSLRKVLNEVDLGENILNFNELINFIYMTTYLRKNAVHILKNNDLVRSLSVSLDIIPKTPDIIDDNLRRIVSYGIIPILEQYINQKRINVFDPIFHQLVGHLCVSSNDILLCLTLHKLISYLTMLCNDHTNFIVTDAKRITDAEIQLNEKYILIPNYDFMQKLDADKLIETAKESGYFDDIYKLGTDYFKKLLKAFEDMSKLKTFLAEQNERHDSDRENVTDDENLWKATNSRFVLTLKMPDTAPNDDYKKILDFPMLDTYTKITGKPNYRKKEVTFIFDDYLKAVEVFSILIANVKSISFEPKLTFHSYEQKNYFRLWFDLYEKKNNKVRNKEHFVVKIFNGFYALEASYSVSSKSIISCSKNILNKHGDKNPFNTFNLIEIHQLVRAVKNAVDDYEFTDGSKKQIKAMNYFIQNEDMVNLIKNLDPDSDTPYVLLDAIDECLARKAVGLLIGKVKKVNFSPTSINYDNLPMLTEIINKIKTHLLAKKANKVIEEIVSKNIIGLDGGLTSSEKSAETTEEATEAQEEEPQGEEPQDVSTISNTKRKMQIEQSIRSGNADALIYKKNPIIDLIRAINGESWRKSLHSMSMGFKSAKNRLKRFFTLHPNVPN